MNINPPIQTDFYKTGHPFMFPDNMQQAYNNLTPRKSRIPSITEIVVFGIQYFILEYVIKQWDEKFFYAPLRRAIKKNVEKNIITQEEADEMIIELKNSVINEYKRMMDFTLGKDSVGTWHLEALWDLGYLPLSIKALPEGTLCPIGVPVLTYTNTHPVGYFLPGFFETIMSTTVWQPMTSATIAYQYKKMFTKYAIQTVGNADFVPFQGHDFSMRGMSSLESACTSGAGHLTSFVGTDTIPAISFLEQYYGADIEKELVGTSVPATEHAVMCMGEIQYEEETFERLLDIYKTGFLSVVSDTWDLTKIAHNGKGGILYNLKDKIISPDRKLVIRPDSGDPVEIICGTDKPLTERQLKSFDPGFYKKGLIESLWDIFGGTVNEQGFKVLPSWIGAIYGDSITPERAKAICEGLIAKGFATTNIVFGIGSFTYQYVTRDTFSFAVKLTYGTVLIKKLSGDYIEEREAWKDPITDDGTKKSAKGLLAVLKDENGKLYLKDQCTKEEEQQGELVEIFRDGQLLVSYSLADIRKRLNSYEI